MKKKFGALDGEIKYQQILLVIGAFLTMVLVSYYYVSTIVRNQMQVIGEEVMNTTQTAVTGSLSETELIFANTAQALDAMILNGDGNAEILKYLQEADQYFGDERSSLPDFLKVYGYIRGEFLDGSGWVPPADYYPPGRVWYTGATRNPGAIFFSEPYIDADTGGMCISFSRELYNGAGESQGVVAIDLNLSRVTNYVATQQIVNNGYGVLLSNSLSITTHRDDALIGEKMEALGGDYAQVATALQTNQKVSNLRITDYDGVDSVAYFRQIFNGWYIGIIVPRVNYYSQVYQMGAVLAVLGAGLAIILSTLLLRSNAAKVQADKESQSKSSFLARMSHEMRTPMNAIIGMTDIAMKSNDTEKIQYSLEKIHDAAKHLLGVINDVLDMSKIGAGKLELVITDFDFHQMVDRVVNVMEFKFEEKHQHFTVDIAAEVPVVVAGDELRLAQVITNLLSNAVKFTPDEGHVALRVGVVSREAESCVLRIEVEDDGIGISAEQQERLFRSFEQADGSISRKYGGTGLGLAISKSIIEMMGGDAVIESELGKGAKFVFTMRVGIGSALSPSSENAQLGDYEGIFEGKRILLAEDVEINQEILVALLEETGVSIDCVSDGQQAYEAFADSPEQYDLIFMDIHMPVTDGYEATRRIRAMNVQEAKTVPIIAMTADVFREDVERAEDSGMNGHVGKPINIEDVIAVMRKYLK